MSTCEYDPSSVDLFDPAVRRDPYPYFAWLRRYAPVKRMDALDAVLVTRYDDVARILRDPTTFSSSAMRRHAAGRDVDDSNGYNVITSDPPVHTELRELLQGEFRVRPLRQLEPRVRELVEEAGDRLAARRTFDLVRDFTVPLPVTVIAELLDIEATRHEDFKYWSDCLINTLNHREGPEWVRARAGVRELITYFGDVLDGRRDDYSARNDILSVLLRAEAEGRLTRRGVIGYSILLLTGGNETTTNLVGGMVLALREHPAALARLRADPALISNAVEEGLRFCSPVQAVYRRTTREVELAGVALHAGQDIVVMLAAANHDETKFARPDEFEVERVTGGHIGFGMGVHHCLGAHLGRLEARTAIEWLVPRLHDFEPLSDSIEWNDTWFVRGPHRLPFAWRNGAG